MSVPTTADAPLRIIVGPTAAGKSAIAMHVAQQRGPAIISADSRQIYRDFNIGTAKPSSDDRRRVPHFGIDVIDPRERYSAHRWARDAEKWIDAARATGREPLIVGGTGFYVRALVNPLHDMPQLDPSRRAALESWLEQQDADLITRWTSRLDPSRALLGRTQHIRAIETALLSGVRLSDAISEANATSAIPHVRYLVVDPGVSLTNRIAHRIDEMLLRGWWDEVRELVKTVPADAPAWNACGYGAVREAIEGRQMREEAVQRVVIETRQYAKRQRTWNRHQLPAGHVTMLDSSLPDARSQATAWWDSTKEQTL